jgi:hypothetical protein
MKMPWLNSVLMYSFDETSKSYIFKCVKNYVLIREVEETFDLNNIELIKNKNIALENKLRSYPFAILLDKYTKCAVSVKGVFHFSNIDEFPLLDSDYTFENGHYFYNSNTYIDVYEIQDDSRYKVKHSCNVFCHTNLIPAKFDLNCIEKYQLKKEENIQTQMHSARLLLNDGNICRYYKTNSYKHFKSFDMNKD